MFANKEDFRVEFTKVSQLRAGSFFCNNKGRAYFKYLVNVCLELFGK